MRDTPTYGVQAVIVNVAVFCLKHCMTMSAENLGQTGGQEHRKPRTPRTWQHKPARPTP